MMEVYRGKRLWIEQIIYDLPNGMKKDTIVIHPGDAVIILPIDGDDCLLIRQWRPVINQYILEAPAGVIEKGELPHEAAKRELIEEIGMDAEKLILLGSIFTTPGFTDERIWIFAAFGLSQSSIFSPDDDEIIECKRYPQNEVKKMIGQGKILDAKTIAAFVRYQGYYEEN
jgi:ADP-ribose pyrophosphatase